MIPMALPSIGGMAFELLTLFVVPVAFSAWREWTLPPADGTGQPETSPAQGPAPSIGSGSGSGTSSSSSSPGQASSTA